MENKPGFSSILSGKAQKEVAVSWEWYEERSDGLGDKFLAEVITRLKDIENNPDRFPSRHKRYREALLLTFPFLIIYKINARKKLVRVVSVFHTSRNPKKKYS